ncbi:protein NRT1/ PTR FAMILY 5.10 [Sesamum alatum]|uniref:Protein NRT1/ PTR FAMILY 5.10 n=1 Tax=Sesamum alatum TaxID=300844 RepID=A0AAE2CT69_9LAMI|nr:protein NRT1/ PTR FAMILY 5.10 [Sesamum alatum]
MNALPLHVYILAQCEDKSKAHAVIQGFTTSTFCGNFQFQLPDHTSATAVSITYTMSSLNSSSDTIVITTYDQNNAEDHDHDHNSVHGMVDYAGRPAKRCQSGYWRSASFIIGVGAAERFAYYGISSNLIAYLTGPLGQSTAAAAASINMWSGTGLLMPILGALVADSFLGRYWTIVFASLLYILALGLLTTSALILNWQGGSALNSQPQNHFHHVFFFFMSLYLMALGQGAHKACIMALGADQFDAQDPKELRSRSSFFNWWYFSVCAAPLAALLLLNYIQDNISWGIGFGIPCISMVIALTIFVLGTKSYRYSITIQEKSCALSRITQVLRKAAAAMNWRTIPSTNANYHEAQQDIVPHLPSHQFKFLNKALLARPADYEEVCSTQEVEETKALVKLIPIWATSLAFAIVLAQPSTLFTKQGITMDRSVGSSFDVPAASLQYIIGLTIILVIPIYDRVFVPLARVITGTPTGITQVERIGTGMFICTLSMVTAALVERQRLKTASAYGLDELAMGKVVPMSFWWLVPQYILYGMADVFTLIGLQELFYDQVPCGLKSVGLSIFMSILGVGNFLSSLLICMIQRMTSEGGEGGWFSDNTNRAHLDYFYWLLAGLNAISFMAFLYLAKKIFQF